MRTKSYKGILLGGLLCGVLDISAAFLIFGLRGSSPVRVLQSIASGLLGEDAYDYGLTTALLGGALHFLIAFSAACVYYFTSRQLPFLLMQPVVSGMLYGVAVYAFMNLIVLPFSAFPHKISYFPSVLVRGLIVHMLCVGLPISIAMSRFSNKSDPLRESKDLSMSSSFRLLISAIFLLITSNPAISAAGQAKATFAGGCFWCMEEAFERVEGVSTVTSGFTGPVEAVQIIYDPKKVDYKKLLEVFWRNIDPTDSEGQFCDRGFRYTSAIFYNDEQQRSMAEESKIEIGKKLKQEAVTPLIHAKEFVAAAEEHQDYYKKNAFRYKQYKMHCGRERRLRSLWKE